MLNTMGQNFLAILTTISVPFWAVLLLAISHAAALLAGYIMGRRNTIMSPVAVQDVTRTESVIDDSEDYSDAYNDDWGPEADDKRIPTL